MLMFETIKFQFFQRIIKISTSNILLVKILLNSLANSFFFSWLLFCSCCSNVVSCYWCWTIYKCHGRVWVQWKRIEKWDVQYNIGKNQNCRCIIWRETDQSKKMHKHSNINVNQQTTRNNYDDTTPPHTTAHEKKSSKHKIFTKNHTIHKTSESHRPTKKFRKKVTKNLDV